MVTNLARFGGRTIKKVCNFYATQNKLYRAMILGYKQDIPCVYKEDNLATNVTRIGALFRLMFVKTKRQVRDLFEDARKTSSIIQLKKMDKRKSQKAKKSKYLKKWKKITFVSFFKTLENHSRINAFIRV